MPSKLALNEMIDTKLENYKFLSLGDFQNERTVQ